MKAATAPRIDSVFRAFADPTRLRILNLLRQGEVCVCDLVNVLGARQPRISQHLAYLRRAGLVVAQAKGKWMYYSLAPARGPFHRKLLECLDCCPAHAPQLAKDAAALRETCCDTGCCD
ncbi:MAG TPA: metalloregulator ArsR/SmtB family transcription factor [Humisphaera sp.]|jgi:ArsR family transcriptional regulator|nr:metalloregulator ArsR/SmtB family transcription factor [Humisphaera sp.]